MKVTYHLKHLDVTVLLPPAPAGTILEVEFGGESISGVKDFHIQENVRTATCAVTAGSAFCSHLMRAGNEGAQDSEEMCSHVTGCYSQLFR